MSKPSSPEVIAHWRQIIEEVNAYAGPKTEWFRARNIDPKQFYYWQRKCRRLDAKSKCDSADAAPAVPKHRGSFVELAFPPVARKPEPTGGFPELIVQIEDCRIFVSQDITEQTLSSVVRAIRNA